jgi:hypothetical protein
MQNQNNRLLYLSPRDMRKNKADALHIMRTCEAFKENGFNVTLITPRVYRREYKYRFNEIWDLYGIRNKLFPIIELPTLFFENRTKVLSKQIQLFIMHFLYMLFLIATLNLKKNTLIYSKSYVSTIPYILMKRLGLISCRFVLRNQSFYE